MKPHDSEMRAIYFESAAELLQTLNDDALRLESDPSDADIIRSIRRSIHTLKGDSAVMGFAELSELAHELEDVLAPETALAQAASLAEIVLSATDMFDAMLAAYRGGLQPPSGDPLRSMIWKMAQRPAQALAAPAIRPNFDWTEYDKVAIEDGSARGLSIFHVAISFAADCPMREAGAAMIRKATQECGEILASSPIPEQWVTAQCIELALGTSLSKDAIAARLAVPGVVGNVWLEQVGEIPNPADVVAPEPLTPAKPDLAQKMLRVDASRIDTVLNLVGELVIAKSVLQQAISEFSRRHPKDPARTKLSDALALQSQTLAALQRSAMQIRMVPVERLFRRFPRLVRDVAHFCGKHIVLETTGQDTDLDKALLDALADPLGHLVRNAVDHGIETPAQRRSAGKPEQGVIRLNAYHQGNQVVIEISDDGQGIDPEFVVRRAVECGFVTAEKAARLDPADKLDFIFEPGFSTADEVTPISGRGVGMDVVKAAVQRLKGTISVTTNAGQGTTFQLRIPLTLAILRAMMFRVREKLYAVPIDHVVEIRRSKESEIARAGNREVIQFRDELLTVARLRRMEGDEPRNPEAKVFLAVVTMGARKFALAVDAPVGEQELVIKPLDEHVVASDMVSGASLLGDGTVALVLNTSEVIHRYAVAAPLMPPAQDSKAWGASV